MLSGRGAGGMWNGLGLPPQSALDEWGWYLTEPRHIEDTKEDEDCGMVGGQALDVTGYALMLPKMDNFKYVRW